MSSADVVIDIRGEEDTPKSGVANSPMEHDGDQMIHNDVNDDTILANDDDLSGDTPMPDFATRFKACLKYSFWNWLPAAPAVIIINIIISSSDMGYFFWPNFFGFLLFDAAVATVVLFSWIVVYITTISVARGVFPRWFQRSAASDQEELRETSVDDAEGRQGERDRLLS